MRVPFFPVAVAVFLSVAAVCAASPVWKTGPGASLVKSGKAYLLLAIRLGIIKYVSAGHALEYLETARDAGQESPAAKKQKSWIGDMQRHMDDWK